MRAPNTEGIGRKARKEKPGEAHIDCLDLELYAGVMRCLAVALAPGLSTVGRVNGVCSVEVWGFPCRTPASLGLAAGSWRIPDVAAGRDCRAS